MGLHNIIMNGVREKYLIAAGMLMSALPVQASVIYEFTTAPISAGVELFRTTGEGAVQTVRTGYFEFGPLPVGVPQTASLTFASPRLRAPLFRSLQKAVDTILLDDQMKVVWKPIQLWFSNVR